jgi:ribosomal protein S18 acetylase RimI-like enzyme
MQNVMIRVATQDDLPAMAVLWLEQKTLYQQADHRFTLQPDAADQWREAAMHWLSDKHCKAYVAQDQQQIVGYVIAWVQDGPPGMVPQRLGVVTELAVGAHSYQAGLGRKLLAPLQAWFVEQGISTVLAHVPHRQPVEQAFWRAIGATVWTDVMMMKL